MGLLASNKKSFKNQFNNSINNVISGDKSLFLFTITRDTNIYKYQHLNQIPQTLITR